MERAYTGCVVAAVACLCLCALGPALAQHPPEGLLYVAHFDTYAGANWAVGSRGPAGPIPPPRLVEGKFGRALLLPPSMWFSLVGDDGNFSPEQGSVEMWMRPNWDGDDGQVHQMFNALVEQGNYLNLNKLDDNTLGVATGGAGVGSYQRVSCDISAWRAGEWHHVAFTWGGADLALFVDAQKVGEADESIPPRRAVHTIGIGHSLDGAIDELAIWAAPRASFDLTAPIAAPEMGEIAMPDAGPPPVGDIDRFRFDLPASPTGCVIVPKHFIDEVDPEQPPDNAADEPRLSTFAAGDEWQSLGFVIYATRDLGQLTIQAGELTGPAEAKIGAENVAIFTNRRVMQRRAPRVPDDDRVPAAALLDPAEPFDLPEGHFKEITVTVHVPADAPPGAYSGTVAISADGGNVTSLPLELRVLPFRLLPSERKQYGVYYQMELSPDNREALRAELQDIRDHGATSLFSYLNVEYRQENGEVVASYDKLDEGLGLLREFGFEGPIIIGDGFQQLAQLLGHEDVTGRDAQGESLDGDEQFARLAEQAIRGLEPLKGEYPEFELVVTHMDEVLNRRLPLYMRLAQPIRRVPEQRIYITLHTLPREGVPELTEQLDPYMDIRCYNGHALDLWLQAGHTFDELGQQLEGAGDEGWTYYNPHRPFYTARWSRIINGLYLWWSPLRVHCPYRYRTMRTYPLSFIHNMAYSVKSLEDMKTPIATRNWEGYRLGMQDASYFCMLEDLVAQAEQQGKAEAQPARAWLQHLRDLQPTIEEIQDVPEDERRNYPLVYTVAQRLDAAAMDELRLKSAQHIMALREALGTGE
jgi:hypothetical protein